MGVQVGESREIVRTSSERRRWHASLSSLRNRLLLGCIVLVGLGAAGGWWWTQAALTRARQAAARGEWTLVREHLTRYLAWHPRDAAAHLLMAEALVKQDTGESEQAARRAIGHLQQIGSDSPPAAEARLQEARLTLLILRQPAQAERLLRESLRLDPDSYDANMLMWKLLDITGRRPISEDFFWRVYELSPEPERALRLRDWFFAEFYPETANEPFHVAAGARATAKLPASVNLLVRFRESEPEAPFIHAALAVYYSERGKPTEALELLKEAPDLAQAMQDRFFVATLLGALVDLGEFEKARTCFDQFPAPHAGYLFWRSEGLFREHVLDDPGAAAESYGRALAAPAGKLDWPVMMKLAECLRKTGRAEEADRVQSRVKHLTSEVLTVENVNRLRDRLRNLRDPEAAREVRDLYREFGLTREAAEWEEHRRRLTRSPRFAPLTGSNSSQSSGSLHRSRNNSSRSVPASVVSG